ncbi:hypothetical protein L9F63_008762 [Diploptera punctata]|uniref:Uncharacterized protein n=1 Tax=Diploptera punctata TaxID=6984 RepID=A0AAD8E1E8_DIPPU|nr:hypothetical protein L9F63_008762 [Diploptera punctata]
MENTHDVQVGPRLLYNAPVTVNQHVHVVKGGDDVLQYALKAPLHDVQSNNNFVPMAQKFETKSFLSSWRCYLIGGIVGVLVIIVALAIIFGYSSGSTSTDNDPPTFIPTAPPDIPRNENLTLPGDRKIYSKEEWYGKAAKFARPLPHPVPFVVISHTVTPPCYTYSKCAQRMRNMQDEYMNGPFPDLGYNFVIGSEGNAYEARGWDVTNMHTGYVRYCNIGISLIGDFTQDLPTNFQINSTQELIKLGVKLGKIDANYKLVPMNETGGDTLSPGKKLYEIMKTWPHFWVPNENDIGCFLN